MAIEFRTLTFERLVKILEAGTFEDGTFDWKETIQPTQGTPEEKREFRYNQRKAAASFGNTSGGHLVFGISNRGRGLSAADRIVGLDPKADLGKQVTDLLRPDVDPPLAFEVINPPIRRPTDGRLVAIVHIPQSLLRPHAVRLQNGKWWEFWKRESGSAAPMTYPEIQAQFAQYEQRRYKVQLFVLELAYAARSLYASCQFPRIGEQVLPPEPPTSGQLSLLFGDIYPLVHQHYFLVDLAFELRLALDRLHGEYDIIGQRVAIITGNPEMRRQVIEAYRVQLRERAREILPKTYELIQILQDRFDLPELFLGVPDSLPDMDEP